MKEAEEAEQAFGTQSTMNNHKPPVNTEYLSYKARDLSKILHHDAKAMYGSAFAVFMHSAGPLYVKLSGAPVPRRQVTML